MHEWMNPGRLRVVWARVPQADVPHPIVWLFIDFSPPNDLAVDGFLCASTTTQHSVAVQISLASLSRLLFSSTH